MIRRRTILLSLVAMAAFARGAVACDSTEEPKHSSPSADANDEQAPSAAPNADAGLADVALDAPSSCSQDGWCHEPLPVGDIIDAGRVDPDRPVSIDLRDVSVSADRQAWAVSDEGYVLRWFEGRWKLVFDAHAPLASVWAASASEVWIAGRAGLVMRGTVSGTGVSFTRIALGSTADVLRVHGVNGHAFAITWDAFWRLEDSASGAGSLPVALPLPLAEDLPMGAPVLTSMWSDRGALWLAGRESVPCPTDDCPIVSRIVLLRWAPEGDGGGGDGASDAGGGSWERVPVEHPAISESVYALSVTSGTAADRTLIMNLATHPNAARRVYLVGRIAPLDAGTLDAAAAVEAGTLGLTAESAVPWGVPKAVWAGAANDVWLVGSPGMARHWDGSSWNLVRMSISGSPVTKPLHAVSGHRDGNGKTDVWTVGDGIAMHRSEAP